MKKRFILFGILLILAGCGKQVATDSDTDSSVNTNGSKDVQTEGSVKSTEGFHYEANGVTINMNVDAAPIVEALGEPKDYFEAASCAFQGLDKIYYYNGFELGTYPSGSKNMISYVNFLDDSVTTEKNIYLGSSLDELITAYGEDYTKDGSSYVYILGTTKLTFIVEDDAVTSITYGAIVEGLNN